MKDIIFGFILGTIGSLGGIYITHNFSDRRDRRKEFNLTLIVGLRLISWSRLTLNTWRLSPDSAGILTDKSKLVSMGPGRTIVIQIRTCRIRRFHFFRIIPRPKKDMIVMSLFFKRLNPSLLLQN